MQRIPRGSDWNSFLRVLAILKRLMEGPATSEELIQSVLDTVGADAYSSAPGARKHAFKHDRDNLRKRLGVDHVWDPKTNLYILNDAGPYGRVSLSTPMLRALSILSRQYENAVGELAGVRDLVQQIIGWLPPETRLRIESAGEELTLDFEQDVDRSVIPPRVGETIQRALDQHRKLTFNYLSPRHADRKAVFHELAPYQIRFQDGHWYLRGYSLNAGLQGDESFLRFRLSYILDDERLRVSPMKVEVRHRQPPRFLVHYQLAPEIGRGEISHRFPEMQITRNEDGSAEVHAVTDDVWDAARTLLAYGDKCIVLGGVDLLREMRKIVAGMAKNYGYFVE
ncbi:MAG: WYL domain-containing protein [Anaerolineales bacterium]|nr:WYL domain-containing protein [Anaerolineales bacterium]